MSDKGHKTVKRGRKLSTIEHKSLEKVFTGSREASESENEVAQNLLRSAWSEHQWIECTCRMIHDQAPTMGIRRKFNGSYILFHLPDRPIHAHTCSFKKISSTTRKRNRTGSVSRLNRILLRLVSDIPLNRYACHSRSSAIEWGTPYKNAGKIIQDLTGLIAPDEHPLITCPGHITALAEKLRLGKNQSQRSGLLLTPIEEFQYDKILYIDKHPAQPSEIKFNSNIRIDKPYHWDPECKGPYLALIQIAEGSHANWFEPVAITSIPIHDRHTLFPVTSDAERLTLTILLHTQLWLCEKKNIRISIEKRFDTNSGNFFIRQQAIDDIIIKNVVTSSDSFRWSEIKQEHDSALYHVVISSGDEKRQGVLTRKFQQALVARILSTQLSTTEEKTHNVIAHA